MNNLKKEQLNSVRDGDFLWDFSFLPENYGKEEISVDSPKSSRQLTITGKQKFICVLNNSKYNTKTFVSAGNDDDVSELLVFDGVKVRK